MAHPDIEACVQRLMALPKGSDERRDEARLLHELALREAMRRDAAIWAIANRQKTKGDEQARRKLGEPVPPVELCGFCGLPAWSCAECRR